PASLTDTNHVLTIPLSPPEFPKPASPGSLSGVAPGVYVTKPFSCMVMVPGQQPDDCIIPATVPTNSIPNAKPSLKFEPLPPADGI
ncbi:MAG TPA: hypothetical protein VFF11_02820, partial [Candidatus Binatia bacterium]|nr:hypothetical protein [Candidatus Binatia bacterium]